MDFPHDCRGCGLDSVCILCVMHGRSACLGYPDYVGNKGSLT
jgi:hypothetical protein